MLLIEVYHLAIWDGEAKMGGRGHAVVRTISTAERTCRDDC